MVDKKTINAGLYIRVSTEKQVREGFSVEAQKTNLKKFVKNQGWNLYDIYADEGISAKDIESRPQVKRLIADIKNKKLDIVVLYKFDRLTRDSRDTEDIIDLIRNYGIEVYTLSGGAVDVSTATGRFSIRISGAVAQLEREQTMERIKVANVQKVSEGYTLANNIISYGYRKKKGQKIQTINPKEAEVVKRVFKLYVNQDKSFTEIANILNADKIPTKLNGRSTSRFQLSGKNKFESIWKSKTIRLMLSNPTYIGMVRYHVEREDEFVAQGKHKPIISKKIWEEAQEKIKRRKKISRTNYPKDDVFFSGTLVCGICGNKLTTKRTKRKDAKGNPVQFIHYYCIGKKYGMCTSIGMSHTKVEKEFLKYIEDIDDLDDINKVELNDISEEQEELNSMKKRLTVVENKRKEVMNLFMSNNITQEQLKYMTEELNKNCLSLKKNIEDIERMIKPKEHIDKSKIAKSIKEHWQYLTDKEKLQFLINFVEKIVIINRNPDRHFGMPEILDIKFYER